MKVLDYGFVKVIDTFGGDEDIVKGARISYGAGTKSVSDDESLIRYLMRHDHTSPFEFPVIRLHIKLPIYVERQWSRHRTASWNERSLRYSEAVDEFHETEANEWRTQSKSNKQGSEPENQIGPIVGKELTSSEAVSRVHSTCAYNKLVEEGVSREQARKVLPVSLYTEKIWQCNLHNLFHFLRLRLSASAQKEIRLYAETIADYVKDWVPMSWKAFKDYKLDSLTLSGPELKILQKLTNGGDYSATAALKILNAIPNKREKEELISKLARIGGLQLDGK